jgi:anti-sigma-K factor RskA
MERMKLAELQQKLTAAARKQTPDERVPYAFEKRIMALLAERAATPGHVLWARALWRAAVSCVALAAVCGAASFFIPVAVENSNDLSQEFENTLLASVDQADNTP